MTEGPEGFDPAAAAALIDAEAARSRESLDTRLHLQLTAWGLAWLVGLGVMWLQVRNQSPYAGPSAASGVLFGVLLVAALSVTGYLTSRATAGVGGRSQWSGRVYGVAWGTSFFGLFTIAAAVASADASARVIGLVIGSGSMFVTGLDYILGAAIWGSRPTLVLGLWLVLVAVVGVWTGPTTLLLVGALAGGGGFLAMAAYLRLRAG